MATPAANDPIVDTPAPRRRWIPVSLRMFVGILVAMAVWSGVGVLRKQATIWAIECAGGRVISFRLTGPRWLYQHVRAVWPYREVVGLDFGNSMATDTAMASVAKLGSLEIVWLTNTLVTDDGVAKLRGLSRLKQLRLAGTRVTDPGVAEVKSRTR